MNNPSKSSIAVYSGIIVALIALVGTFANLYEQTQLERVRHDASLVLEAIDDDIGKTRDMLLFLLDSGLIQDPGNLREQISHPDSMPNSTGAIACYSNSTQGALYSLGSSSVSVMGFVGNLQGRYLNRIFHPQGFPFDDISDIQYFKDLCASEVPSCLDGDGYSQCWAGGDTGGYYGFE